MVVVPPRFKMAGLNLKQQASISLSLSLSLSLHGRRWRLGKPLYDVPLLALDVPLPYTDWPGPLSADVYFNFFFLGL